MFALGFGGHVQRSMVASEAGGTRAQAPLASAPPRFLSAGDWRSPWRSLRPGGRSCSAEWRSPGNVWARVAAVANSGSRSDLSGVRRHVRYDSLLNAWSGLSAGFCGVVMQSQVLTACGATVAASGLILTHAMCRAMNRSLAAVLLGGAYAPPAGLGETPTPQPQGAGRQPRDGEGAAACDPLVRAAELIHAATRVIFVPGYGMALAHAQRSTVQLAKRGESGRWQGCQVCRPPARRPDAGPHARAACRGGDRSRHAVRPG